jgi:hypothetical protein
MGIRRSVGSKAAKADCLTSAAMKQERRNITEGEGRDDRRDLLSSGSHRRTGPQRSCPPRTTPMPVTVRKERLRTLLSGAGSPLHLSDHQIGRGRAFYDHACTLKVEGTSRSGSVHHTLPAIAACG